MFLWVSSCMCVFDGKIDKVINQKEEQILE